MKYWVSLLTFMVVWIVASYVADNLFSEISASVIMLWGVLTFMIAGQVSDYISSKVVKE